MNAPARGRGKVAVVTGGSTGIGRGIARRLAAEGYRVAVLGRRGLRLRPKRGERQHPYVCDIADAAQVKTTVRAIVRDLGRIDALVNNAGTSVRVKAEAIERLAIDRVIGTNLIGTMAMTAACIPALKKTQGAIVNISSSLTQRCFATLSVYAASKGGMDAFARTLAVELAPSGVRVNTVSPSLVRSEIHRVHGTTDAENERKLELLGRTYFPLGRSGEPEDVAALVAFLLSAEASWITGINIPIDGGESAGLKAS